MSSYGNGANVLFYKGGRVSLEGESPIAVSNIKIFYIFVNIIVFL